MQRVRRSVSQSGGEKKRNQSCNAKGKWCGSRKSEVGTSSLTCASFGRRLGGGERKKKTLNLHLSSSPTALTPLTTSYIGIRDGLYRPKRRPTWRTAAARHFTSAPGLLLLLPFHLATLCCNAELCSLPTAEPFRTNIIGSNNNNTEPSARSGSKKNLQRRHHFFIKIQPLCRATVGRAAAIVVRPILFQPI